MGENTIDLSVTKHPRKKYECPRLERLGTLADMTRALAGKSGDNSGISTSSRA